MTELDKRLATTLNELRSEGTAKLLREVKSAMGHMTTIEGVGECLVFYSNNYVGIADHPEVI